MKVFCQHCTGVGRDKMCIEWFFSNPCDQGCSSSPIPGKQTIIWRQKLVASVRLGNSMAARPVSPGRIKVVLFWTKYAVPCQIKPGIFKLTIRGGQKQLEHCLYFLSLQRKWLLSCRFGRTAQFWLPLVMRAQPPYTENKHHFHWNNIATLSLRRRRGGGWVKSNVTLALSLMGKRGRNNLKHAA